MKVQVADVTILFREVEFPVACPHCQEPTSNPGNPDDDGYDPIVGTLSGQTYRATLDPIPEIPTVYRAVIGKVDDDMEIGYYGKHVPLVYNCGACDLPLIEGKVN